MAAPGDDMEMRAVALDDDGSADGSASSSLLLDEDSAGHADGGVRRTQLGDGGPLRHVPAWHSWVQLAAIVALVLVVVGNGVYLSVAFRQGTRDRRGAYFDLPADHTARAHELLRRFPLVDGHNDLPSALRSLAGGNPGAIDLRSSNLTGLDTTIPWLRQGGLGAQFWSVYVSCSNVPSGGQGAAAVQKALEVVDIVYQLVETYPDVFQLARTADDIEAAFAAGRIASLMGLEGSHMLGLSNQMAMLRTYYRLGVRYMTLTHSCNSNFADSCYAPFHPPATALSPYGRLVVAEMNRLGMLVDLSHVSPDVMRTALAVSQSPVIFSHSDTFALAAHPRNVPDDVLALLPANGGIVMINYFIAFVSDAGRAKWAELRAQYNDTEARALYFEWQRTSPDGVTVQTVAEHIDHVVSVTGSVDHVSIAGGDFDGVDHMLPYELSNVAMYPNLVKALLDRGYSNRQVVAMMGGNLLRVLRANERKAAELQATTAASYARDPSNLAEGAYCLTPEQEQYVFVDQFVVAA